MALPTDGSWIEAVSADGRQVLLERFDPACAEGCECPTDSAVESQSYGFALLDLGTTTLRPVIDPVALSVCDPGSFRRHAEFNADGTGILVSETWYGDQFQRTRVRASRVEASTGAWSTILDEPIEVDEMAAPTSWNVAAVVETGGGLIVTSSSSGIWVRGPDGDPIRELDRPEAGCDLVRAWGADTVLARCGVPVGEFAPPPEVPAADCHTSGLWVIATDGSPARALALPVDDRGYLTCWLGYTDAEPLGEWLAVQVSGDGCSDNVVVISADGSVTRWTPPGIPDLCTESLIGVRNGAWLIRARSEAGDDGTFEVTSEGSTRADLPTGEIFVL